MSVQTVSAVLNHTTTSTVVSEEKRKRIVELANTMGYVRNAPALSLVKGQASTIGLVCFNLRDPHYLHAIEVAERVCTDHGHALVVATARQKVDWTVQLTEGRVDFLLVISMGLLERINQEIPKAMQKHVAVVGGMVNQSRRQWGAQMTWDDRQGVVAAARHLLDCGCRKIAILAGAQSKAEKITSAVKLFKAAGINPILVELEEESDHTVAGEQMGEQLLEHHPDVDGVFLRTDRFYVGLLRAFCQSPKPLSMPHLVGYGGFYANLTSVCTPMKECVEHVLTTYFRDGVEAIKDRTFETTLNVRS